MTDSYDDIHGNVRHWLTTLGKFLDNPVFYDVGANKGMFVKTLSAHASHIVAFEPVLETSGQLKDMVASIESVPVDVIVAGLGSGREDLVIHQYSDDTFNSLYDRGEEEMSHYALERMGSETVHVISLDSLLSSDPDTLAVAGLAEPPPPPGLIKIDIEGAELSALEGMGHTLSTHAPFIVCEYSVDNTANAGYSREEILRFLNHHGYSMYGLFRNEDLHLHRALGPRAIWNIIAVPGHRHAGFQRRFDSVIRRETGHDPQATDSA